MKCPYCQQDIAWVRATFGPHQCPHCRAVYIRKIKHKKQFVTILAAALIVVALAPFAPPRVALSLSILGSITMVGIGIYALIDAELRVVGSPKADRGV